MKRIIFVLLAAVVLAGCSGSHSHLYTLAKSEKCLVAAKLPLKPAADFVATTATGGATRVLLPDGNAVTLVFGQTQSDADGIDAAYVRFHAKNVGINDVLRQDHNAVMLWHFHPSDEDAAIIGRCLT